MEYLYMRADMYNLVLSIGQVNALGLNYSYAMIPGEERQFGPCDIEISERKAEPRPEIRGDIARIYFYMDNAYTGHGILSKRNRKLFKAWAKADPVDDWERERCRHIEAVQGNKNKFNTIKWSSIVSIISIQEALQVMASTQATIEIWLTISTMYLVLCLSPLSFSQKSRSIPRTFRSSYDGISANRPVVSFFSIFF
ncbi:endonuclease [Desulfobacter hydrogenophilus]|uniref:endonuclease n=1 Tax=Desulfobacter hydrogenophilus TaxID=2291 RepID=UPI001F5E67FD|nr:endonuclease [Desulfobacter hydrogenophilus]